MTGSVAFAAPRCPFTCVTADGEKMGKASACRKPGCPYTKTINALLPACLRGRCVFASHCTELEPHLPYLYCPNEFTNRISLSFRSLAVLCGDSYVLLSFNYKIRWHIINIFFYCFTHFCLNDRFLVTAIRNRFIDVKAFVTALGTLNRRPNGSSSTCVRWVWGIKTDVQYNKYSTQLIWVAHFEKMTVTEWSIVSLQWNLLCNMKQLWMYKEKTGEEIMGAEMMSLNPGGMLRWETLAN